MEMLFQYFSFLRVSMLNLLNSLVDVYIVSRGFKCRDPKKRHNEYRPSHKHWNIGLKLIGSLISNQLRWEAMLLCSNLLNTGPVIIHGKFDLCS